jgi:SAM-dependent MidA family methyltransferase
LIDLSFYVDFTNLLKAVLSANIQLQTKTITQKDFLEDMGIHIRAKKVKEEFREKNIESKSGKDIGELIDAQVLRLTGNEYMGRGYKFMFLGNQLIFPFIH